MKNVTGVFRVGKDLFCIVLFVGNFWLAATTDTMLESMLEAWSGILSKHRHTFSWAEVSYGTTVLDEIPCRVAPFGQPITRVDRAVGF